MDEAGEELVHVGVEFGFGFESRDPIRDRGSWGFERGGIGWGRCMEVSVMDERRERISGSGSFEVREQEEGEGSHLDHGLLEP